MADIKIPKSINILGFNYEINLTEDKNILNLNQELVDELKLQNLCHAIVHAFNYLMTKNDENLTENQTDVIGTGLASILLNNKLEENNETV